MRRCEEGSSPVAIAISAWSSVAASYGFKLSSNSKSEVEQERAPASRCQLEFENVFTTFTDD